MKALRQTLRQANLTIGVKVVPSRLTLCIHTVLRYMDPHRYDLGLLIHCGINSCPEQYRNYDSFRSLIYRKHREALAHVTHPIPTQPVILLYTTFNDTNIYSWPMSASRLLPRYYHLRRQILLKTKSQGL